MLDRIIICLLFYFKFVKILVLLKILSVVYKILLVLKFEILSLTKCKLQVLYMLNLKFPHTFIFQKHIKKFKKKKLSL